MRRKKPSAWTVVSIAVVGVVMLGACSQETGAELTEPVTGESIVTPEPVTEESVPSSEEFPFAKDLMLLPLEDCQDSLLSMMSEVVGGEPTIVEMGTDGSGFIFQQSGEAPSNEDASNVLTVVGELTGPGSCILDSGVGTYGQTEERETLSDLPEGVQGLRWETRFLAVQSDSCSEYVERREFWLLVDGSTLHLTAGNWFGCSVDGEFSNEVSWDDVRQQAKDAHEETLRGW